MVQLGYSLINIIVAALVVAALFYFGGGLYAVANDRTENLIEQRTQPYWGKSMKIWLSEQEIAALPDDRAAWDTVVRSTRIRRMAAPT